jgi:HlyD family secretion protein
MPERAALFRDTSAQDAVVAPHGFLRRHYRWLVGILLVLVAAALVLPTALRLSGIRASVSRSRITIAAVERGEFVRDFVADGRVVAANSPTQYAPASGRLALQVRAGDQVKRGQLLARLDSPDLLARLSQEQATLTSLRFDLRRAQLEADRALSAAEEAHAQADVDHTSAKREYERTRKAYELGAFSEMQLLRAQDAYEKARFRVEQSERVLQSQKEQGGFEIQSRDALLKRQQVAVDDLTRQVAQLEIRSPVDGQVGQLQVADRANVVRDAPLLSVVDLSLLEVEIQAPESLARDLSTGMAAELSANGQHWQGSISGVSPEVTNGQITARVRFTGPQPDGLRQSQRMSVRVVVESRPEALTVERGALADQGSGYAWRVDGDVATRVPVRLGAASIARIEILEGLRAGDHVVVSGIEALGNAERVIVAN